jgi:hypothetical protein
MAPPGASLGSLGPLRDVPQRGTSQEGGLLSKAWKTASLRARAGGPQEGPRDPKAAGNELFQPIEGD